MQGIEEFVIIIIGVAGWILTFIPHSRCRSFGNPVMTKGNIFLRKNKRGKLSV